MLNKKIMCPNCGKEVVPSEINNKLKLNICPECKKRI